MMAFQPSHALTPGSEVEVRWGAGMHSRAGANVVDQDGRPLADFHFSCQVYQGSSSFTSNGQRIYFTATSASGDSISFAMGAAFDPRALPGYGTMGGRGGWSMMGRGMMGGTVLKGYGMSCASCHGPDRSGGRYLAMGRVQTPSIQYATLTDPQVQSEHGAYNDDMIKRAIREGLEPDGEPLEPFMPRWMMSDRDLADLLAFLRTP